MPEGVKSKLCAVCVWGAVRCGGAVETYHSALVSTHTVEEVYLPSACCGVQPQIRGLEPQMSNFDPGRTGIFYRLHAASIVCGSMW